LGQRRDETIFADIFRQHAFPDESVPILRQDLFLVVQKAKLFERVKKRTVSGISVKPKANKVRATCNDGEGKKTIPQGSSNKGPETTQTIKLQVRERIPIRQSLKLHPRYDGQVSPAAPQ
jgi:hypothetical protein